MARQSLIHYAAYCTCGAECVARNALAWAHNHANRNPGHAVELQLGYYITTNAPGKDAEE